MTVAFAFIVMLPAMLSSTTGQRDLAAPARLSGVVVAAEAPTRPISGVEVVVILDGLALPRSTVSDAEGRFAFVDLPPGRASVTARKAAYLPGAYGTARPGHQGVAVDLIAGRELTRVEIRLTRGAVISGTVFNPRMVPVQGAPVTAVRTVRGAAVSAISATTETDDLGQFRFYGLAPGTYLVASSLPVSVFVPSVEVMSDAEVDARLAALTRGSRATSTRPGPAPKPSAPSTTSPIFYPSAADPALAQTVTVTTGAERDGVDILLRAVGSTTVRGVVIGAQPGSTITVTLRRATDPTPLLPYQPRQMHANERGQFQFMSVPPGRYVIEARSQVPLAWARANIDVEDGADRDVALSLRPVPSLSGVVRSAPDQGSLKIDFTTLRIALTDEADFAAAARRTAPVTAPVDADGRFTIAALPPGRYDVQVSALPAGVDARSAIVGDRDTLDHLLEVTPDSAPTLSMQVTLSARRTGISGDLAAPPQHVPSSYFIVAFPADAGLRRSPSRRVRTVRPSTGGTYQIDGLPSGDYLLAALTDFDPEDVADDAFFAALAAQSVRISLTEGVRSTVNLKIAGGGW